MIEATCAACGAVNRIAEADVPVGAKFLSCTSCKSKIPVPASAAKPAAAKPIAIPAIPAKLPTPPKGVPSPSPGSSGLSSAGSASAGASSSGASASSAAGKPIDLADLPAPKRLSPLAGAEPSKPAPRSALAGAELPVPKGGAKPPAPQAGSLDLDDLMPPAEPASAGLADLPAPKPRPSPLGDLPSKPAAKSPLADLPAPKKPAGATDLPAPKGPAALADLPAPKRATPPKGLPAQPASTQPASAQPGPVELRDLPAPKRATPPKGVPAPQPSALADAPTRTIPPKGAPASQPQPAALGELPAPKRATPPKGVAAPPRPIDLSDLPAPRTGITDLPTPKAQAKPGLELDDDLDLPMPKPGVTDLPMPKAGVTDLPMPKPGVTDLPMPKPGVTDLPMPKPGANHDLPAPKGFFDDLPQPARKGGGIDLPAPKGFFDDLPQPAPASKQGAATQDIAPKGFFDDLPQPAKTPTSQDLAPKGLFDDLPQPSKGGPPAAAASGAGLFDDIQQPPRRNPSNSPANAALGAGDIDLGPSDGPGLDLAGPELDLGLPLGESASSAFQDLDLSEPTPKPQSVDDGSPIKIKTPAKGAVSKPIPINVPAKPGAGGELKLDLAEDPHDPARTGRPAATAAGQKITPKSKVVAEDSPEARAAKRRRSRIMLGSLLGVVALGAGGFYFYQRHAAAQARAEEIDRNLKTAERQLRSDVKGHWARAKNAGEEAIKLDATNARALGLTAEAMTAGALDTGLHYDQWIGQARIMINDALGAGHTSPELERAQAVAAVAAKGQAQRAVELLKTQIAKNPKDGWLHLYMGWAQNAKGDSAEAVKAFDQAIALAPQTKLPALYGQGVAKLAQADVAAAQAAFAKILEVDKDHVCANVGLIATKPPAQSAEQVVELEAVLQRKDISTADPRCVVQAHVLIGDTHRKAGRLDMARQRYNDALKLFKSDVGALDGLAATELRDGKLKPAAEYIEKSLAINPEHPETLLLEGELMVSEGKLPDAQKLVDKLAARQPPLLTLTQARLFVVKGKLLEAKGQDEDAITAYGEGAKLAGELDLTPTMAAVRKLSDLAKKATDPAKATEYRGRAAKLLEALEAKALEDAQLSTALGVAYMEAGDPVKGEVALRRAVALRGDDPEAKLQLAKALNLQTKFDEALTQLKDARQLEPKRTDIMLDLAITYQRASRHDEAIAAYEKLLALPDVPLIVRVNAGRYFAQRGNIEKAAEQGALIVAAEPDNAGGLYLKAEGLLEAGKPEEATPLLVRATDVDPEAQYLDALGRMYEARWKKSNDGKFIESARGAYERAAKANAKMFHPLAGQGRMLVAQKNWEPAVKALEQAAKLDPASSDVKLHMALAYYGLRNSNKAYKKTSAQWFESALKAQPEVPLKERADAWNKLTSLYEDADINDIRNAIRAYENAIRAGEQIEKEFGATASPPWLTESYYFLGDLYYRTNNPRAQKAMFLKYVDRNPPKSERLKRVNNDLATSLQRY